MKNIWILIYNYLIIPVFYTGIQLAGFFDAKIKKGIKGRKRIFEDLILNSGGIDKTKKLIWFHSSSYGEFEQAKPIIKELKRNERLNILVTFFSPSGYENSKKYPYADLVSYIPLDTKSNAERFIKIVNPSLAVMMRYDIWPNHIWALSKANIPCFIVDATMKERSARKFLFIKNFHKNLYTYFTKILTVSLKDAEGFKNFGCTDKQLNAVGDTRFDRVYQRSQTAREKELIRDEILKDKKIFVAGSTWEADEDIILPAFKKLAEVDKDVILIIAPHEPTIIHLENIENEFISEPAYLPARLVSDSPALARPSRDRSERDSKAGMLETIRFSFLNNYNNERVIIVDSIGILLTLYIYADVAFVGGGFRQSIHNVLEAAVYGVPVLFGPKIDNSQEAQELLRRGGGVLVKSKTEAYRQLRTLFSNDDLRKSKGKISNQYVQENLGATEKILEQISKFI